MPKERETVQHREEYRGHKLWVIATKERETAWSWGYLVDSNAEGRSPAGKYLPDAEAALRRGCLAARARADDLG